MKLLNHGSITVEHKKWYDCAVALSDSINASPRSPSMSQICKCQIQGLALMLSIHYNMELNIVKL